MTRWVLSGLTVFLLALLIPPAAIADSIADNIADDKAAATRDSPPSFLRPYKSVYNTTAHGLSIKLERQLSIDENRRCTLTSEGSLLVVGLSEISSFRLTQGQVEPISYVYQGTGLISRRREVHFMPESPVIRSLYKNEWYALPDAGHTLDRMSQQEQMRLNLLAHDDVPQEMTFTVADGRKVKDYTLELMGSERLQTPMGKVDTLQYERQRDNDERLSQLWVAPDWDYLIVKTLHIENGKTIEANLIRAQIDGTPVSSYIASL
ncbi:MAG: DUF3108 domain-containing protein [Chromatocurvus sp.]